MTDTRNQISDVLYNTISATMNRPVADLNDGVELVADLGAKSVNLVRIIADMEDQFDLDMSFQEFRNRKTIGDIIDYVVYLYESQHSA